MIIPLHFPCPATSCRSSQLAAIALACAAICCLHIADADFIAFKQRTEGDPELLPSAEVQLDLKEQAKKMIAGLPHH